MYLFYRNKEKILQQDSWMVQWSQPSSIPAPLLKHPSMTVSLMIMLTIGYQSRKNHLFQLSWKPCENIQVYPPAPPVPKAPTHDKLIQALFWNCKILKLQV